MQTRKTRVPRPWLRTAGRAAACLALIASAACDDIADVGDVHHDVVIGGVFSLTGTWSSLGVTSKAALEMAVEDVNAYAAGRGVTFHADVRDTKLDPATALAAVQSLRAAGVQVIIGPQSSAELATLKPYVDANPVLMVSQSSTAGSLAIKNDRIFRFTPADSLEGVAASALMWSDGVRTIVPVWRADAGNQGLHAATAARITALGGTATAGVEYGVGTLDFSATVSALRAQVRQALATRPAYQVAVYYAGFDETADLFALISHDAELASVRWYGADGIAQSPALLAKPGATTFAEAVGFPAPVFGLDPAAQAKWQPLAARIKARAGSDPDAFALAVYDAVWVAAQAYLASPRSVSADELAARFTGAAGQYYGATGWTQLNAAGDRAYANFDFWAVRATGTNHAWTRVASYNTAAGTLTRF